MINMGKQTKRSPAEVVAKAVTFFGPNGVGLEIKEQTENSAQFEAMGGFVTLQVVEAEGGRFDVSVFGREFDYQIKQFVGDL